MVLRAPCSGTKCPQPQKSWGAVEGDQAKPRSPRETKVSQKQAVKGRTRRCHWNAGVMSGPHLPAAAPTDGLFAEARAQHPWVAHTGRVGAGAGFPPR